ncbi:hypothetical protein BJ508DRAFT_192736, partial [Ascobolus immersus RN42]
QGTVRKTRPCRITMAVDVSPSMTSLIDPVIQGIQKINQLLAEGDLISILDFAVDAKTIFPYLAPNKVDWSGLNKRLRNDIRSYGRGSGTALWDAIAYLITTVPRDFKYKEYKPELVIFTDGEDNRSRQYNHDSIQQLLKAPRLGHVHITIIDASRNGNSDLEAICSSIQHCTFTRVEASQEAVQRVFVDVVNQITQRLTLVIQTTG